MTSPGPDTPSPALFGRPLGNTVHLPLTMATLWTFVAVAAGAAVTMVVGAVAALTSAIVSVFDPDVSAAIPWDLLRSVALALAPVAFAAAIWAAAYGSGHDRAGLRTLFGTAAGLAVLALLAWLDQPPALLAALALGWATAVPFEHWGRWGLRLVFPATASAVTAVLFPEPGTLLLVAVLAVSPAVAAAGVWLGDLIWLLVDRARDR